MNLATAVVSLLVLTALWLAARTLLRDRKNGKSSCGCTGCCGSCTGCGNQ